MGEVNTPWGGYDVIWSTPVCRVKRLFIHPGERTSLQVHSGRDERWILVDGSVTITCGERVSEMAVGDEFRISSSTPHRLANSGQVVAILIEIWTGPLLDEADIERIEDDYGRVL